MNRKKKRRTILWQQQHLELCTRGVAAIGNTRICERQKIALISSQKCPGDIILKTYDFARFVRGSGDVIVSGFHSPIEKDCLPILLRGLDPIIIVQAHKLSTSRFPPEWRDAIEAGRLLLLSPFDDKDKRVTRELAIERNRFIVAISDEVLIPYAYPGSTTEALFRDLISSGKRVYTFQSQANAALISAGAVAIAPDFFKNRSASSVSA